MCADIARERYDRYIGMLRESVSLKKGEYLLELFGMDRGIGSQGN